MSWVLILETINEAMPSKSLISFERETNEFDIEAKKKKKILLQYFCCHLSDVRMDATPFNVIIKAHSLW